MHDAAKLFNLRAEPFKLFLGDAIVLRIARFDIGVLELFEPGAIALGFAGPDIGETRVDYAAYKKCRPEARSGKVALLSGASRMPRV